MAGPEIHVVGIGRMVDSLRTDVDHYTRLVRPFGKLTIEYIKPPLAQGDRSVILEREAELLRRRWPRRCWPVALSCEGKEFDSHAFAHWLGQRIAGAVPVVFTLGGAFGLCPTLKNECREVLTLSRLTFSHRLACTVIMEQVYRACAILSGHPYHKE